MRSSEHVEYGIFVVKQKYTYMFIVMHIHIFIEYARVAELDSRNHMLHSGLVHIDFRGQCATDNVWY